MDKRVDAISGMDFASAKSVPFVAVFYSPDGYPGQYVARLFDGDRPTDAVVVRDSLAELEREIRNGTDLVWADRGAIDEPELVGVWF